MARLQGEQLLALHGSLRTMTVTLNPDETTGDQTQLPNSEPASGQVSYTIAAEHLPTISPAPERTSYNACIYVAGRNTSGGTRTIYWRVLKNGVSIRTGNGSCTNALQYWTVEVGDPNLVVVGDTIEVRVWVDTAGACYWDYNSITVVPTRMYPERPWRVLLGVTFTTASGFTLVAGGKNAADSGGLQMGTSFSAGFGATTVTSDVWVCGPTYGMYRVVRDNSPATPLRTHATLRPWYNAPVYISSVTYRPGPDIG